MPESGIVTVWVRVKNANGCIDSTSHTIAAEGTPPTLTLLTGNNIQSVTEGTAIGTILYTTTDATGAAATGLPAGVSGAWSNNTFTISGTPTAVGTFPYTVTTTNADGCPNATATGTITATLILPAGAGTFTWTCGSQMWSGALRKDVSGCAQTSTLSNNYFPPAQYKDNGATYGYYYNWTCVNDYATTLCPSPWRVPTQTDFHTFVDCINDSHLYNTLITAWGLPGYASGSSMNVVGVSAHYWSAVPHESSGAYYLLYGSGNLGVSSILGRNGLQVRCVRDN
jgi:uncharacterized protein (TIGR02145 family)